LVLLASGWSLMVLVVTGLVLTALFHQAALSRFDQGLNDVVQGLYSGSSLDERGQVLAPAVTDVRALRAYSGRYWQIAEPMTGDGLRALVRSRSLFDAELQASKGLAQRLQKTPGAVIYYDVAGPDNEPLRAAALLARLPGRSAPVVFMAAEDRSPVDRDDRRFAAATALALILLGAGLIAAVVIQVRFGLKPLFDLRRDIAGVRQGKTERLAGDYPSELQPVAQELNALLSHNQEVVERQRTHVGNLAHALKTPLSVMQAEAERHPGDLALVVRRQVEAMRQQVDHYLRRARAAARSQGAGERTLVEPVIDELARTLEKIFQDRGVQIDWTCPADLAFLGERQDLLEIIGNGLENACKWGKSAVMVQIMPEVDGRFLVVIEDDGPGLPPERRTEVLQRGARLDETAPGSGLGLSIIDELARAYGGGVQLAASQLGGLRLDIKLPAAET
jgi:signal transduction histidine kinase